MNGNMSGFGILTRSLLIFRTTWFSSKVEPFNCEKGYVPNSIECMMDMCRLVPLHVIERTPRKMLLLPVCQ